MHTQTAFHSLREIERIVHSLISDKGTITFTTLAGMLPAYRWISLFKALNNLERQQVVRLRPLPWDYEISVCPGEPSEPRP